MLCVCERVVCDTAVCERELCVKELRVRERAADGRERTGVHNRKARPPHKDAGKKGASSKQIARYCRSMLLAGFVFHVCPSTKH